MKRQRERVLLRVARLAAVVICVARGPIGCVDDDASDGKTSDPFVPPPPPATVEDIVQQRTRLDETLFAHEVEAQAYEQVFVRLWDDLRSGEPYAVFKAFPFGTLSLPRLDAPEQQDWGAGEMRIYRPTAAVEALNHAQFEERLEALRFHHWRIVQTEWHHARFEPAAGGRGPRSVVSAAIHLSHDGRNIRFILRALLNVGWSDRRDDRGDAIAETIEATEVELIEQRGQPMFEKLLTIDTAASQPAGFRGTLLLLHDLDGDGLSEILLPASNLVYWNRAGGRFEPRDFLPSGGFSMATAGILADFDGDAAVDFLCVPTSDGHLRMYRGDAQGRFTAPAREVFSENLVEAQTMTAGDADGDGDLDLFVGQWRGPYLKGAMPTPFYDALDGPPDYFLENLGDGNFTDATQRASLAAKRTRRTYSASLVDLDDDGDLDLMVVCDFAGLDLYRNDGTGRFTEVTEEWVDERHAFGMAHALADFDSDGRLDFYMIGMSSTTARRLDRLGLHRPDFADYAKFRMPMAFGNRMYLARDGRFVAPEDPRQVARTGWSWGCTATDFDNDGDVDIYVANGHISGKSAKDYCTRYWSHDIYAGSSQPDVLFDSFFKDVLGRSLGNEVSWNGYEHNVLYLNRGEGRRFLNAAFLLGAAFEFDARAVASDDLDGDGRRDLLVVQHDRAAVKEHIHVLRNRLEAPGAWIGVRLVQGPGGCSPLGAKVSARAASRRWIHHVVTGDSLNAQHAPTAHFGLGRVERVEAIEVRWSGGEISTLQRPRLRAYHVVESPRIEQKVEQPAKEK